MDKKKIGIIGGGIAGAALGYYLSLYEGEADITVFEKNRIGCGTTAKSAGTVCLFDDSLNNRYWDVRLYGFETYCKFEREEKGSTGFDQTGTLVVALGTYHKLFEKNFAMRRLVSGVTARWHSSTTKAIFLTRIFSASFWYFSEEESSVHLRMIVCSF